jgi:hypothetical protein
MGCSLRGPSTGFVIVVARVEHFREQCSGGKRMGYGGRHYRQELANSNVHITRCATRMQNGNIV